jgi:hypothetical protein
LIELSIVLIIIGLLVAGVTGGSSLIKSAQLRGVMSEARGWNVATNAFIAQYDELPGDYNVLIAHATDDALDGPAGDADGTIEYLSNGNVSESLGAWYQLINSKTIDSVLSAPSVGNIQAVASGSFGPISITSNMPASKLDGVGWMFGNSDAGTNVVVATGEIAAFNHATGTSERFVATGVIDGVNASSIDTKLDDGIANTGRVQGSSLLATPADCFTAGVYASTESVCALEFTVDIT